MSQMDRYGNRHSSNQDRDGVGCWNHGSATVTTISLTKIPGMMTTMWSLINWSQSKEFDGLRDDSQPTMPVDKEGGGENEIDDCPGVPL